MTCRDFIVTKQRGYQASLFMFNGTAVKDNIGYPVEKAYSEFVLVSFVSVLLLTCIAFLVVWLIADLSDYSSLFETAIYVGVVTLAMVIVLGTFSFFVKLDDQKIKIGFPGRELEWGEIERIKIVGMPRIKFLNRMILSTVGSELEVKLFIFKSQEKFIFALIRYLSWAEELSVDNIPSEAYKK